MILWCLLPILQTKIGVHSPPFKTVKAFNLIKDDNNNTMIIVKLVRIALVTLSLHVW